MNSFLPKPPIGMTTFSGQSCVLGTADNCGLLRDECGALALAETLIGQDMGSIGSQRWRAAGMAVVGPTSAFRLGVAAVACRASCSAPHCVVRSTRDLATSESSGMQDNLRCEIFGSGCQLATVTH